MPSNNPLIGFGFTLKEPKLYDVLQILKKQILIEMNCVKIAEIVTFTAATRSADVKILAQRVMKDGTVSSYPQLSNCPVFTLQGGGTSLQFPIKKGDQCLVLFADRNLDNWYQNGNAQPPADGRLHDLSDGIVLVGLNFSTDASIPVADASETRLVESDGLTKIGLKTGKITLQNQTGSLLTTLQDLTTAVSDLITVLNTLTTTGGPTTQTISAATVAALVPVTAELTNVQTELTQLLY